MRRRRIRLMAIVFDLTVLATAAWAAFFTWKVFTDG
jgi:hypothetical protein